MEKERKIFGGFLSDGTIFDPNHPLYWKAMEEKQRKLREAIAQNPILSKQEKIELKLG